MGYAEALFARDYRREEKDLQKKVRKKSLWGSIGRTLGGLGAMALTGGALNPFTTGLLSGGASFLGGAIGAKGSELIGKDKGKLTGGTFMQDERKSLQTELGGFGSRNIAESLKAGITAGITQKLRLGKEALAAEAGGTKTAAEIQKIREGVGLGEGFKDSFVGRGLEKRKELAKLKNLQLMEGKERQLGVFGVDTATYSDTLAATKDSAIPELAELFETEGSVSPIVEPSPITTAKGTRIDKILQERGPRRAIPTFEGMSAEALSDSEYQVPKGILPGHGKLQSDIVAAKSDELAGVIGAKGAGYKFGESEWKGLGESFASNLNLPDSTYGTGTFGLSSTARGYDFPTELAKKSGETEEMMGWQSKLFDRSNYGNR